MMRDKEHMDVNGNLINVVDMDGLYILPHTFNTFSVTDCTFYELCHAGLGSANDQEGTPRKEGWYVKQRAFYSGYQRGMEACLKHLSVQLPNEMTGAIYGPTSGCQDDQTLFR